MHRASFLPLSFSPKKNDATPPGTPKDSGVQLEPSPANSRAIFPRQCPTLSSWHSPFFSRSLSRAPRPDGRRTKIIATLGPASSSTEMLEKLMRAGANIFRFNFSHGDITGHINTMQTLRQIAHKCELFIETLGDLQGPKLRTGLVENGKVTLVAGADFIFDTQCTLGNQARAGVDYEALPGDVKAGDILVSGDGAPTFRVMRTPEPGATEIHTQVLTGGVLSNRKGINKQGGGLSAPALTLKDEEDIKDAVQQMQPDYMAVSFVRNADDMHRTRKLIDEAAGHNRHGTKMIAKIERTEAPGFRVLKAILKACDGIMVARGDLAVEVGHENVARLQRRMIQEARRLRKMVIVATQMMDSMEKNPTPTRAEVSDIFNAVVQKAHAVMLSGETASGQYPVEAVTSMANICLEAENVDALESAALREEYKGQPVQYRMELLRRAFQPS